MLLVTEETWKQMMVRGFVGTTRAKRGLTEFAMIGVA